MTDDADDNLMLAVGDPQVDPEKLDLAERVVEAVLFAAPAPVPAKDLAERLPAGIEAAAILKRLQERYQNRGVHLMQIAGGWAFQTAPDLAAALTVEREETRKLTRAQIETLAVIAYHQPITRPEIEEIRGVSISRGVMDALIELGWIRPGRRREAPGRPLTWLTTQDFLLHFGLNAIAELPGLHELQALGMLDERGGAIADFARPTEELELPEPAASTDPDAEIAEDFGADLSPTDEDDKR